jgi:hypothetical protein
MQELALALDGQMIGRWFVDAKGDLIAATAADTVARLPVGATGQILTVDPTQATGLRWANPPSGAAPSYGTTLPATPSDGQEHILVDSLTNPTYQWRFRYNAGSTSAYKWEFIGGDALASADASDVQIGATTGQWLDPATPGPLVTVPRPGDYDVEAMSSVYSTVANATGFLGLWLGTATSIASIAYVAAVANSQIGFTILGTGLAASTDIRLRYFQSQANHHYTNRIIRVRPRRVS